MDAFVLGRGCEGVVGTVSLVVVFFLRYGLDGLTKEGRDGVEVDLMYGFVGF